MKYILITIFFTNSLFSNYAYDNQSKGKIDMHGGKSNSLINDKNSLSNSSLKTLSSFGISNSKVLKKKTIINKDKKKENQ